MFRFQNVCNKMQIDFENACMASLQTKGHSTRSVTIIKQNSIYGSIVGNTRDFFFIFQGTHWHADKSTEINFSLLSSVLCFRYKRVQYQVP